jgi:predicted O-methyltransferase YrrM
MLRSLAASKPGGRLLELGTGTGVATAWLLDGMDARATLVSVDNDAKVQQVAKDILGQDGRLTLVTGGASEFLRSQLIERLAANAEFQILPLRWASGVVIAVRKS